VFFVVFFLVGWGEELYTVVCVMFSWGNCKALRTIEVRKTMNYSHVLTKMLYNQIDC
jgi:hypothetical protein